MPSRRADARVRVPKEKPVKRGHQLLEIPPGAVIYGAVTPTINDGGRVLYVHGRGGFHTSLTAKKGAKEVILPSASIIGIGPGDKFVAWDGSNYVLKPTLDSIHETDDLTLIGAVGEWPQTEPVTEQPPLHPHTKEAVDQLLHRVDQTHWPLIAKMRVPKYIPLDVPVPPSTPQHLLSQIQWYASMLFKTEADQFAQFRSDQHYPYWLSRLVERVESRVRVALNRLEEADPKTLIMGYHGLGQPEIDKGLQEILFEIAESYKRGDVGAVSVAPEEPRPASAGDALAESAGAQIKSLRVECGLSVEELATALDVATRTVYKHLSDRVVPRRSHVTAYEKLFSERLGRKVTLKVMRQAKGHAKGQ
jgi:DNA-binding transcriptional regulator YiaG